MNEFFKFLFNPDIISNTLRPEWIKLYDVTYIDTKVIESLKQNVEIISDLLSSVMIKAQGMNMSTNENTSLKEDSKVLSSSNQKYKKTTVFEPFNLTQPKPKKIQEPMRIPNKVMVQPLPVENYQKVSLEKLEQKRKDRREIIKDVYIIYNLNRM